MADNAVVTNTKTAFDGDTNPDYTVAADEISSAKYQRVKITLGADGVNDGDVSSSNAMPAKQSGTWNITDVSGTVSLPTGAATAAKQDAIIGHVDGIEALLSTIDTDTGDMASYLATIYTIIQTIGAGHGSNGAVVAGSDGTNARRLKTDTDGNLQVDVLTNAASATATRSQVADNASDVELLAANASRKGATIFNDSSALLYLGLGTTAASATNYTAKVFSNAYYEVPFGFTGQIRGIWATDPGDGAARITELT